MDLSSIVLLLNLALSLLLGAQHGTPKQKANANLIANQAISYAVQALKQPVAPTPIVPQNTPIVLPNMSSGIDTNKPVVNTSCELKLWAEIQYYDKNGYSPILHYSWTLNGENPNATGTLRSFNPSLGTGQTMAEPMINNPAFTTNRLPYDGGRFEADFNGVKCNAYMPQLYPWVHGSSTNVYSTPQ